MKHAQSILSRNRETRLTSVAPLASRPGNGAQPPAPVAASMAVEPMREQENGSKLLVGANIKLKGVVIDDCDTLVVEGRVEAAIASRALSISASGAFCGKAEVDVAEIRGHYDGELTVRSKLVVHASGRVHGKVRYGKLLVQEGGEVQGDVAALGPEAAAR